MFSAGWVYVRNYPWIYDLEQGWSLAAENNAWVYGPYTGWTLWGVPPIYYAPENIYGRTMVASSGSSTTTFNFSTVNIVEMIDGTGTFYSTFIYRRLSANSAQLTICFVDSDGFAATTQTTLSFLTSGYGTDSGVSTYKGDLNNISGQFWLY